MLINTSKTKVMLITTDQKRNSLNVTEMNLNLNGKNMCMISKYKVLGVFIDKVNSLRSYYVGKLHQVFV